MIPLLGSSVLRCAIILLALPSCIGEGGRDVNSPAADATLALQPFFRDLLTVRAAAGDDSVTLLLDTGGGATLITPQAAQRIGCQPFGRDVGHRMTGEAVEFRRCDSLTLRIADWSAAFAPVAVYDVNALLPPELARLDGVLSLDAFRGQVITLDWPRRQLIVHSTGSARAALDAHGITTRVATGETGRTLTVLAKIVGERGPLWFLLDSGNLRGTLVDSLVLAEGLLPGISDSVSLTVEPRDPFKALATSGRFILDGVLGTSFLMREPVAIDLRWIPR